VLGWADFLGDRDDLEHQRLEIKLFVELTTMLRSRKQGLKEVKSLKKIEERQPVWWINCKREIERRLLQGAKS